MIVSVEANKNYLKISIVFLCGLSSTKKEKEKKKRGGGTDAQNAGSGEGLHPKGCDVNKLFHETIWGLSNIYDQLRHFDPRWFLEYDLICVFLYDVLK